jgi:hypothetical protein
MADIGLPNITINFTSTATSSVSVGTKGYVTLIIKDDTDSTFNFAEYTSVDDLTSTESAKYTADNLQYITDVLEGTPLKLTVARMDTTGTLADLLTLIKAKINMNSWIGMADAETTDSDAIVSWVKSANTNSDKRYKAFVYSATTTNDKHIVNFTNSYVTFADDRGYQTGDHATPYLLGFLGGLTIGTSSISEALSKFDSVTEPDDLDVAIADGQFVLYNDEGDVRVARGVNSLIDLDDDESDDMKYILIIEIMDLIYTDIYSTWKSNYKGKYPNSSDNQTLLISAINAYFETLEDYNYLDDSYDNYVEVDTDAQRLANYSTYGETTVKAWSDDYADTMTVGTNVYLAGQVKILNSMEDLTLSITM